MLNWVEAKRWRVIVYIIATVGLAAGGGFMLNSALKYKASGEQAAEDAAAAQVELAQQANLPQRTLPPLETSDLWVERATAFAEQAFTWDADNYADVRQKTLAWADGEQAVADIEAMLPDAMPQVKSEGAVAAAWRTGASEVMLRLRQTVVRSAASGYAHGVGDHLLTIQLDQSGKVSGLTVVYTRGEVS
jgi:hypothetical protein